MDQLGKRGEIRTGELTVNWALTLAASAAAATANLVAKCIVRTLEERF